MDVDTTQKKQSHEKILTEFSENKIDVLLGTQMVSKGLDYPGISLVGVLAADMSLNVDDYRAQERTFDLITQVCGRAGRGDVPGRAIIQTYMPEDATIGFAKNQDYIGFYEAEIAYRKLFCYPPFCDILCFVASGEDEGAVRAALIKVFQYMKALLLGEDITWYAPHPAPIYKIKSKFRYRFWLKCSFGDEARCAVRKTLDYFYGKKLTEVNLAVSINPNSMY